MPQQVDEQRDPVASAFFGSVMAHAGLGCLVLLYWFWLAQPKQNLGESNPGGGPAVSVAPVHSIPIPHRDAAPNPVANDSQSAVPTAPAKQEAQRTPPPEPKAEEIPDRTKPRKPEIRPQQPQQYKQPVPENQIQTQTRQAVSNPMYAQSGAGQVGIGPNSPLGARLGWYAELIRQRIAQNWNTAGLDPRSQGTPAIVSFVIMRDGSVRSVRTNQSSGNPTIDDTAMRAVLQANPLPPLPPQISDSSLSAQFTFNLR